MFRMLRVAGPVLMALCVGCGDECDDVLILVGEPVNGEFVYRSRCQQCHGENGKGGSAPSLVERLPQITSCDVVETVRSGPGTMPDFGKDEISTEDLNDLIEFMTLEFQ